MECLLLFQFLKNFKNVVKTTDFPNHIYYTNDTVKNMRSRVVSNNL